MMKKILISILALSMLASSAFAVPSQLTYSGRLLQNGALVNSTLPMDFYIYNHLTNSSATNVLWSTTNVNVDVNQGIYSVVLGDDRNPVSPNVFVTDNAYLQVVVNTEILSPRTRINSVGYALQAGGLSAGGVQAVFVTANGRIGMGTSAPSVRLDVSAGSAAAARFTGGGPVISVIGVNGSPDYIRIDNTLNAGGKLWRLGESGAGGFGQFDLYNETDGKIIWTGLANGNVGIGTTAPAASLDVKGNIKATNLQNYYLTRTLPANANDTVDIGDFMLGNSHQNLDIAITVGDGSYGYSVSKRYLLSSRYGITGGGGWYMVLPISSAGGVGADFGLEAQQTDSPQKLSLRVRRTLSGSATTAIINIQQRSDAGAYLTESTNTNIGVATLSSCFPSTVLTQVAGLVGIGTSTPRTSLDIGQTTDGIIVPQGTTAQRPGTPVAGTLRYNSTTGSMEYYTGTGWVSLITKVVATAAGAQSYADAGGYRTYTFTGNGTFTASSGGNVEVLVVAGGGGGGESGGGGGGGGGVVYSSLFTIGSQAYSVVVGGGGSGGVYPTPQPAADAQAGGNSSFSTITAIGGGGGSSGGVKNGGSGGGARRGPGIIGTGAAGQGNNGGTAVVSAGGGGGGAGAVGGTATGTNVAGNGGAGYLCPINNITYGGGGGGGTLLGGTPGNGGTGGGANGKVDNTGDRPGNNGGANTGGGGGASYDGGNGGSGIVIIRYPL
jgi:hypothetical protein